MLSGNKKSSDIKKLRLFYVLANCSLVYANILVGKRL